MQRKYCTDPYLFLTIAVCGKNTVSACRERLNKPLAIKLCDQRMLGEKLVLTLGMIYWPNREIARNTKDCAVMPARLSLTNQLNF